MTGRLLLRLLRLLCLRPVHLSEAMAPLSYVTLVCEYKEKNLRVAFALDKHSRLFDTAFLFFRALGIAAEHAIFSNINASGQEVQTSLEDVWIRIMSALTSAEAADQFRQRYAKSLSIHADSGLATLTLTVSLVPTFTCQAPAAVAAATGTVVAYNRTGSQPGVSKAQVRSLPACFVPGNTSPGAHLASLS